MGVSEQRLEEVLLVEDGLVALDGGDDLLLENPYDFFCRLLLEVGERARSGSGKTLSQRARLGGGV